MYQKKLYKKAAKKFEASIKEKSDYTVAIYNLACTYSLLKKKSKAIKNLKILRNHWQSKKDKRAFRYLNKIKRDKDFDSIRDSDEFKKFMESIK